MAKQLLAMDNNLNLWLETVDPSSRLVTKVQVDGNTEASNWQALDANTIYVKGTDGNLWLEKGPFGQVPLPSCGSNNIQQQNQCRIQVDANVASVNNTSAYYGIYGPMGAPAGFCALDDNTVFVLGSDRKLWLEYGPFGQIPLPNQAPTLGPPRSCRFLIDGNVINYQPIPSPVDDFYLSGQIYVLGFDGNLWLEWGPFYSGSSGRVLVDANVLDFWAIDGNRCLVEGLDGNLWLEYGPFGQVPLPTFPTQFPPALLPVGFSPFPPSARFQVDGNVGFYTWLNENPNDRTDQVAVCGMDLNLWLEKGPFGQVPPSRVQIDGNVGGVALPGWLGDVSSTSGDFLVLGWDQNLWWEIGPFGQVPLPQCNGPVSSTSGCRTLIDSNVDDCQVIPETGYGTFLAALTRRRSKAAFLRKKRAEKQEVRKSFPL